MVDVVHFDVWNLDDCCDAEVHHSADRGEVVQRHQGIHLVLSRAQQFLHHDQPQRFKDNATQLEHEADEDELDLSKRSYDDTDHDEGNLEQGGHLGFLGTNRPSR